MSPADLIARHRLEPHPFEGYWRETAHHPGTFREGLQLLTGIDEAAWHELDVSVTYALEDGGPLAITLSHNGQTAYGHKLLEPGDTLKVGPGVLRTISCLGAAGLIKLTLAPDAALTDRRFAPDNWVPGPQGRPVWPSTR